MECLNCPKYLHNKYEKAKIQRRIDKYRHFKNIKEGLIISMKNIDNYLDDIYNWDELMNIKEESPDKNELKRNMIIKKDLKSKRVCFSIFGLIFCLLQLIGVQAEIIILNSLFSEIVDEFKLWLRGTPREHNFHEKLQIFSYKEYLKLMWEW